MSDFEWSLFSEKQLQSIEDSDARLNFWEGSVRSGKTIGSIVRWIEYIQTGPSGELLMIGKTERTLQRNILDLVEAIVGPKNYRLNRALGEAYIFGRRIYIVGANDERSENKIRGLTLSGAYGDELTLWPESFFKMLLTRLSVRGAKFFGTTNPDSPFHWLKTDYLDNEELDLKRFHFTLDDNYSLDPDYVASLKKEFAGVFYQRFILGNWVIAEGLVYGDDYNPEVHKVSQAKIEQMIADNEFYEFIGGTDFGFTHPMTGLIYGLKGDPLYPEYYQIAEYHRTKKKTEDLRDWYLGWEDKLDKQLKVIFCDSAEPDRILTLQEAGLRATSCDKQINPGINTVQTLFKNNRLYIGEHCKETDNELSTYRYPSEDDSKNLQEKDQPLDQHNHVMDGKRYCLHNYEKHLISLRRRDERRNRKAKRRRAI